MQLQEKEEFLVHGQRRKTVSDLCFGELIILQFHHLHKKDDFKTLFASKGFRSQLSGLTTAQCELP